jgi:co-chaperonin GroES (HSP10)
MKITPQKDIVQLEIEEAHAGVLVTSSLNTAVEFAKVLSIGEDVKDLKVGDKVFVKAWGIDIVTHGDKKYFFCNVNTNAILAVVK